MAIANEEIEDKDLDKEENLDGEKEEEGAEGDGEKSGDADKGSDEPGESEDDEDGESDSDDEDSKPVTLGALKKILASNHNRSAAERRGTSKGRSLSERAPKGDERIDRLEQEQRKFAQAEAKRQFGYDNGLSPDEVDVVFRVAGPKARKKDLEDAVVQGALEGHRKFKRAKANIPSSSGGRPGRVSAREEKNLTQEQRDERMGDRRREILAGKR